MAGPRRILRGRVGSIIRTALMVAVVLEVNLILIFSLWSNKAANKDSQHHPTAEEHRAKSPTKHMHLSSADDFWSKLEDAMPTAPADIIRKVHKATASKSWETDVSAPYGNLTCLTAPPPWMIRDGNTHWQSMRTGNGENLSLYRAYYDDREKDVRVLLLSDRSYPIFRAVLCVFFDEDGALIDYHRMREGLYIRQWVDRPVEGGDNSYLFSCPIPEKGPLPAAVSLISRSDIDSNCTNFPTNLMTIENRHLTADSTASKSTKFCVCTRPMILHNPSIIPRLVEWLELLAIIGAGKVVFYYYYLSEEIRRTMRYYEEKDLVQLIPLSLPGKYTGDPALASFYLIHNELLRIQTDIITYNDCLYRYNMLHEYMTWLDIDEVIVPLSHDNWYQLANFLDGLTRGTLTSFAFKNTFFMDDFLRPPQYAANPDYDQSVPEYHHILRHLVRSERHTPMMQCKSIHKVGLLKTVRSHHAGHCLGSVQCNTTYVDEAFAHLAHYRNGCMDALKNRCEEYLNSTVEDIGVLKYKDKLLRSTSTALEQMGFLV